MEQLDLRGVSFCGSVGRLTATGAETVYDTTLTINFQIRNSGAEAKTAITDGTTPTTDYVTGSSITLTASKARVVVWGMIAGGTTKVIAGDIVDWDGVAFLQPPQFPSIPDAFAPFAYQILKASSSAGTITFGSSNWNATGFTNTIKDVLVLPGRPQTS